MNIRHYTKRKQLERNKAKAVAERFTWRDRQGTYHDPAAMQTAHLFYTIRMIWNHTMVVKLAPYAKYGFTGTYTPEYFEKALRAMVPELAERENIAPHHQDDINTMVRWLTTVQLQERKKEDPQKRKSFITLK